MDVDDRLEPAEPVDLVRLRRRPSAGPAAVANEPLTMSAKQAAVNTTLSRRSSERDERLCLAHLRAPRLERNDRRTAEQRDRQQQVRHHDRPAQVARNREQTERRLRERAEEDGDRQPHDPARQADACGARRARR